MHLPLTSLYKTTFPQNQDVITLTHAHTHPFLYTSTATFRETEMTIYCQQHDMWKSDKNEFQEDSSCSQDNKKKTQGKNVKYLTWIKFRVDKKEIKSTRNTLKWGQPRNLIYAKFNF